MLKLTSLKTFNISTKLKISQEKTNQHNNSVPNFLSYLFIYFSQSYLLFYSKKKENETFLLSKQCNFFRQFFITQKKRRTRFKFNLMLQKFQFDFHSTQFNFPFYFFCSQRVSKHNVSEMERELEKNFIFSASDSRSKWVDARVGIKNKEHKRRKCSTNAVMTKTYHNGVYVCERFERLVKMGSSKR